MEGTGVKRKSETPGRSDKKAKKMKEKETLSYNPRTINVSQFALARAAELRMVHNMHKKRMQTVAQTLPRHMQRRAMSSNIKRLPCRLRKEAELKKIPKKNVDAKAKRSRRHRRRPSNLRKEFEKRQNKKVWLETHLWHAKRFKMEQRWKYCLPLHSAEKGVRAAYRGVSQYCTMQDISFHEVIQLSGPQEVIVNGLALLTKPETGLTFKAAAYINGQRHGQTVLYHQDSYPYGAIGPVSFLWRAMPDGEGHGRCLWIWVHPAIHQEVMTSLQKVFNTEGMVEVRDCSGDLLRFRLQGPSAHCVIKHALQLASVQPSNKIPDDSSADPHWWQQYYKNDLNTNTHTEQSELWDQMKSAQSVTELPSNCVVGLVVRDPRVTLPLKKLSVNRLKHQGDAHYRVPVNLPLSISISPIWDTEVRSGLTKTMKSTHEINTLRSDLVVPGSELKLGDEESRIPILLLQHPGTQQGHGAAKQEPRLGFGEGWDVILPKKWGTLFWVSLIYNGARAVGKREADNVLLHQGQKRFPEDFPDTKQGDNFNQVLAQEMQEKFLRKPPAKRLNFAKMGFISPFQCPWKRLMKEWSEKINFKESSAAGLNSGNDAEKRIVQGSSEIYVLRDKRNLMKLSSQVDILNRTSSCKSRSQNSIKGQSKDGGAHLNNNCEYSSVTAELTENHPQALIWVHLNMVLRGNPGPFSMICIPTKEDIEQLKMDPTYIGPRESIKRQFGLDKKKKKSKKTKKDKSYQEPLQERLEKVKLLELNSRLIIGFVTNGKQTFGTAKGSCVGFCLSLGLHELLKSKLQGPMLVLVRDRKSLQYRFAYMQIPAGTF